MDMLALRAHLSQGTKDHHLVVISKRINIIGSGWVGGNLKLPFTEPRVSRGESDEEGEALVLQGTRMADLQARSEAIFCGPKLDQLGKAIGELFATVCR
jgi:hypothetical protein